MAKADVKREVKRFNKLVAYKRLFSTDDGKRVLVDLMTQHHLVGSTFCGKKPTSRLFAKANGPLFLEF